MTTTNPTHAAAADFDPAPLIEAARWLKNVHDYTFLDFMCDARPTVSIPAWAERDAALVATIAAQEVEIKALKKGLAECAERIEQLIKLSISPAPDGAAFNAARDARALLQEPRHGE